MASLGAGWSILAASIVLTWPLVAIAQTVPPESFPSGRGTPPVPLSPGGAARGGWRAPGEAAAPAAGATHGSAVVPAAVTSQPTAQPDGGSPPTPANGTRPTIARVSKGTGTLPNDHGQVWREYDITPYTLRVTTTNRPEQAIVDWILRETGYEAWHSAPLGILSADRRTLRVYHTPQMQDLVGEVVDRFVNSEAETHAFGLRVVSIANPNWRAKSHRLLRPVSVQSQGVQAWLLAKEDASLLIADLRRRTDFREYSSPHLLVNNGQSAVVAASRPRNYIRNVTLRPEAWPGFEPELAQIEEGFSLEMSPLLSLDGHLIDTVIKCNLDQVEKMMAVAVDAPTAAAPRQRAQIEVPQLTSFRLHERFRWPTEQVLLISCGVVATPVPTEAPGIKIPLLTPSDRAELLIFVESRGRMARAAGAGDGGPREAQLYRDRY
jgi:hypothetical protein